MSALTKRGFMFWSLTPFLLLFLVLMPFLVEIKSIDRAITLILLELVVALFWLALFDPIHFWWAGRVVGGGVFCFHLIYLAAMICAEIGMVQIPGRRAGGMSSINALLGLFVFGLPGLCYVFLGRFTFRVPTKFLEDDDEFTDDDAEITPPKTNER